MRMMGGSVVGFKHGWFTLVHGESWHRKESWYKIEREPARFRARPSAMSEVWCRVHQRQFWVEQPNEIGSRKKWRLEITYTS
jgi:hypothetical protein